MFDISVSKSEPKNIKEAMANHAWIEAMMEVLHGFNIWELVDKPIGKTVINLRWLWKNKKDEDNTVIRNKARLAAKDFRSTNAPRGIFINRAKYALEILKKNGMDKCDSIGTPMDTKPKLNADLSSTIIDQTRYQSMIGSLMYLTSSKPDMCKQYVTVYVIKQAPQRG
uniref:Ribonuclease H-like domain-containing protein n=1 Tax=Tanacetum cinerariifolium TaxID=118510 RepID=A0A6L2MTT8_TANCI|nr:ribonuclease H-like domain-containing protein [Tanacetum cinerariifolium]